MNEHIIRGHVHKYGDNINTDIISPSQYMELPFKDIAAHAMEGIDPEFIRKVRTGDIIVAGKNFGSGSSRETAPIALKHAGIGAVVAESFARIFYRNAFNIGLPVLELNDADKINNGDHLEIDLLQGMVQNITQQKAYRCMALPDTIMQLIKAGGLVPLIEKTLSVKRQK